MGHAVRTRARFARGTILPPATLRRIVLTHYPAAPRAFVDRAVARWCRRRWRSADALFIARTVVENAVRHQLTPYDALMNERGLSRQAARENVGPTVAATLKAWRATAAPDAKAADG